jgi:hypothetical protein
MGMERQGSAKQATARNTTQRKQGGQQSTMSAIGSVPLAFFSVCLLSSPDKRAECRHPDTRYFIVTQVAQPDPATATPAASSSSSAAASAATASSAAASVDPASSEAIEFEGTPVAFCAVRFTTGDQDQAPIAYM